MKYVLAVFLMVTSAAYACDAATLAQIEQLKVEIARRQAAIEIMKSDGRATGRFEMALFRLQQKLKELSNCNTNELRGLDIKKMV
jgi:hypothetical protein